MKIKRMNKYKKQRRRRTYSPVGLPANLSLIIVGFYQLDGLSLVDAVYRTCFAYNRSSRRNNSASVGDNYAIITSIITCAKTNTWPERSTTSSLCLYYTFSNSIHLPYYIMINIIIVTVVVVALVSCDTIRLFAMPTYVRIYI